MEKITKQFKMNIKSGGNQIIQVGSKNRALQTESGKKSFQNNVIYYITAGILILVIGTVIAALLIHWLRI